MNKNQKTKEKTCAFYASDYHFEMISLPYINKKLDESKEVIVLTENNLKETIKKLVSKINLNEDKKVDILKIDWENNDLNKFKKINEDIKSKKDMVIFVKGKENYIKNINENIERLILEKELEIGDRVEIEGQFRSYNSYENEKNRLILTVFAKDIKYLTEEEENLAEKVSNEVTLVGYICKKPIYRQTPFGREISDILLAVNRAYNKSDYIPAIAWGRNARFCQNIEVGTKVKIAGRVQSRNYEKKFEDGTTQTRTAYEVSISSLEIVNEEEENKEVI